MAIPALPDFHGSTMNAQVVTCACGCGALLALIISLFWTAPQSPTMAEPVPAFMLNAAAHGGHFASWQDLCLESRHVTDEWSRMPKHAGPIIPRAESEVRLVQRLVMDMDGIIDQILFEKSHLQALTSTRARRNIALGCDFDVGNLKRHATHLLAVLPYTERVHGGRSDVTTACGHLRRWLQDIMSYPTPLWDLYQGDLQTLEATQPGRSEFAAATIWY